jgi:glycosyltransferase involved in cell wall biosynthesis
MSSKPKILLCTDWYEPGFRAGGPIRSCVNFVRNLKDDFDIYVFTSDRDLNDSVPYAQIELDKWIESETGVRIYYASPASRSWKNVRSIIKDVAPDILYLNSMFSLQFTIYPLLICRRYFKNIRIVLAPRGMLKPSALRFKSLKKKIFLKTFRLLELPASVTFQATDEQEQRDIGIQLGTNSKVHLVPNFPGVVPPYVAAYPKKKGELKMIFVGRIHPVKNLDYLLRLLTQSRGCIQLTVVGNEEDREYFEQVKQIAKSAPENVKVNFIGEVPNNKIAEVMNVHHIFAMPTSGENFGHSIFEAMSLGKPVLISDQTPWRDLTAQHSGWDISLQRKELFLDAIQQAVDFDNEQYCLWSKSAWRFVQESINNSDLKRSYINLFSR